MSIATSICLRYVDPYTRRVPKLWSETIEAHRHAVEEAILDAAGRLVTEGGLTSVTMSQVAKEAGIGRATLYKYFADVEAILFAWHQRHIAGHLELLTQLGGRSGDPQRRLETVLQAYAMIAFHSEQGSGELAALLHRREHLATAQQQLLVLVSGLLSDVAEVGQLRRDVSHDELAAFCVHALTAASSLTSEAAVGRLVKVTLTALRPTAGAS